MPIGSLSDLHQQRLALREDALDRLRRRVALLRVLALLPDVGDVQEAGAVQPDLDEGRLHAREHPRHLAGVDIADQAAARRALDVQLLGTPDCMTATRRFLRRAVDQDVLGHGSDEDTSI